MKEESSHEESLDLLDKVKRIHIRSKKLVSSAFAGEYSSAFRGRGMEFEDVREYVPGDEVRSIDWNVTARSGYPHVKNFREERELTLLFIVDVSPSTHFGSVRETKLRVATQICGALAFSAISNNDRVGLITFSGASQQTWVPPRKGRHHALRIIRDVLASQNVPQSDSVGTDIPAALEVVNASRVQRAIIFLISDFWIPESQKDRSLSALRVTAHRHDITAIRVLDRHEAALPNVGLLRLRDMETGKIQRIDTSSEERRRAYERHAQEYRHKFDEDLNRLGIDHVDLWTDRDWVQAIIRFFRRREKKR